MRDIGIGGEAEDESFFAKDSANEYLNIDDNMGLNDEGGPTENISPTN